METRPLGELLLYTDPAGEVRLQVSLRDETFWLSAQQIADLFGIDRTVVGRHIRNVFASDELEEKGNVQKMHVAGSDRPVRQYSLDVVISVGYRTNSLRATRFRVWATRTLRRYLLEGYALNRERLLEVQAGKLRELQETIGSVARLAASRQLTGHEGELLELIDQYAHSWKVLEEYDSGEVEVTTGQPPRFRLTYPTARRLVDALAKRMAEGSSLFGQEVHGKLRAVLGALDQSFDGDELYRAAEEKAAHLLYFGIKDHPFVDGNKRISSFLFIYYLQQNGLWLKESGERRISDNALAALALMVAESRPEERGTMVRLLVSLLQNG